MPLRALASASPKLKACLNFSRRLAGMVICDEILKFHSIVFRLCLDIRRRNFDFIWQEFCASPLYLRRAVAMPIY